MISRPIRVLVVDDHPIVRDGLRQVFARTSGIVVEGEAGSGREALDILRRKKIGVMILDVNMPGMSWLDVIRDARHNRPELAVLILSMHDEQEYITRSLKAGAAGYLTKESIGDELVRAVEKVAKGGKYVSAAVAEKLADFVEGDRVPKTTEILSEREFQVMLLLARGRKPSEIARELFLSVNTVNTYKARIFEKMNIAGLPELVRYAVKAGLIE
jgi:two-component system, NarL family, invasion response regulator UvrY